MSNHTTVSALQRLQSILSNHHLPSTPPHADSDTVFSPAPGPSITSPGQLGQRTRQATFSALLRSLTVASEVMDGVNTDMFSLSDASSDVKLCGLAEAVELQMRRLAKRVPVELKAPESDNIRDPFSSVSQVHFSSPLQIPARYAAVEAEAVAAAAALRDSSDEHGYCAAAASVPAIAALTSAAAAVRAAAVDAAKSSISAGVCLRWMQSLDAATAPLSGLPGVLSSPAGPLSASAGSSGPANLEDVSSAVHQRVLRLMRIAQQHATACENAARKDASSAAATSKGLRPADTATLCLLVDRLVEATSTDSPAAASATADSVRTTAQTVVPALFDVAERVRSHMTAAKASQVTLRRISSTLCEAAASLRSAVNSSHSLGHQLLSPAASQYSASTTRHSATSSTSVEGIQGEVASLDLAVTQVLTAIAEMRERSSLDAALSMQVEASKDTNRRLEWACRLLSAAVSHSILRLEDPGSPADASTGISSKPPLDHVCSHDVCTAETLVGSAEKASRLLFALSRVRSNANMSASLAKRFLDQSLDSNRCPLCHDGLADGIFFSGTKESGAAATRRRRISSGYRSPSAGTNHPDDFQDTLDKLRADYQEDLAVLEEKLTAALAAKGKFEQERNTMSNELIALDTNLKQARARSAERKRSDRQKDISTEASSRRALDRVDAKLQQILELPVVAGVLSDAVGSGALSSGSDSRDVNDVETKASMLVTRVRELCAVVTASKQSGITQKLRREELGNRMESMNTKALRLSSLVDATVKSVCEDPFLGSEGRKGRTQSERGGRRTRPVARSPSPPAPSVPPAVALDNAISGVRNLKSVLASFKLRIAKCDAKVEAAEAAEAEASRKTVESERLRSLTFNVLSSIIQALNLGVTPITWPKSLRALLARELDITGGPAADDPADSTADDGANEEDIDPLRFADASTGASVALDYACGGSTEMLEVSAALHAALGSLASATGKRNTLLQRAVDSLRSLITAAQCTAPSGELTFDSSFLAWDSAVQAAVRHINVLRQATVQADSSAELLKERLREVSETTSAGTWTYSTAAVAAAALISAQKAEVFTLKERNNATRQREVDDARAIASERARNDILVAEANDLKEEINNLQASHMEKLLVVEKEAFERAQAEFKSENQKLAALLDVRSAEIAKFSDTVSTLETQLSHIGSILGSTLAEAERTALRIDEGLLPSIANRFPLEEIPKATDSTSVAVPVLNAAMLSSRAVARTCALVDHLSAEVARLTVEASDVQAIQSIASKLGLSLPSTCAPGDGPGNSAGNVGANLATCAETVTRLFDGLLSAASASIGTNLTLRVPDSENAVDDKAFCTDTSCFAVGAAHTSFDTLAALDLKDASVENVLHVSEVLAASVSPLRDLIIALIRRLCVACGCTTAIFGVDILGLYKAVVNNSAPTAPMVGEAISAVVAADQVASMSTLLITESLTTVQRSVSALTEANRVLMKIPWNGAPQDDLTVDMDASGLQDTEQRGRRCAKPDDNAALIENITKEARWHPQVDASLHSFMSSNAQNISALDVSASIVRPPSSPAAPTPDGRVTIISGMQDVSTNVRKLYRRSERTLRLADEMAAWVSSRVTPVYEAVCALSTDADQRAFILSGDVVAAVKVVRDATTRLKSAELGRKALQHEMKNLKEFAAENGTAFFTKSGGKAGVKKDVPPASQTARRSSSKADSKGECHRMYHKGCSQENNVALQPLTAMTSSSSAEDRAVIEKLQATIKDLEFKHATALAECAVARQALRDKTVSMESLKQVSSDELERTQNQRSGEMADVLRSVHEAYSGNLRAHELELAGRISEMDREHHVMANMREHELLELLKDRDKELEHLRAGAVKALDVKGDLASQISQLTEANASLRQSIAQKDATINALKAQKIELETALRSARRNTTQRMASLQEEVDGLNAQLLQAQLSTVTAADTTAERNSMLLSHISDLVLDARMEGARSVATAADRRKSIGSSDGILAKATSTETLIDVHRDFWKRHTESCVMCNETKRQARGSHVTSQSLLNTPAATVNPASRAMFARTPAGEPACPTSPDVSPVNEGSSPIVHRR